MGTMRVRVEVFAYLTDHGVDTEGLMGSLLFPYIYLIKEMSRPVSVGGVVNSWLIISICSLWFSTLPVPPFLWLSPPLVSSQYPVRLGARSVDRVFLVVRLRRFIGSTQATLRYVTFLGPRKPLIMGVLVPK